MDFDWDFHMDRPIHGHSMDPSQINRGQNYATVRQTGFDGDAYRYSSALHCDMASIR